MNDTVAASLDKIATLYAINSDSHRSHSFARAAKVIRGLASDIATIEDPAASLNGIGKSISKCIKQLITTGTCDRLEQLQKNTVPSEIIEQLTKIPGVGPVKAKDLYTKFNAKSVIDVKQLIDNGEIIDRKLVANVQFALEANERTPIGFVLPIVIPILQQIRATEGVQQAEFAGSLRRHKETIRDVDIIASTTNQAKLHQVFRDLGDRVDAEGESKFRIFKDNLQIDLLIVPIEQYNYALLYFTGSKEFNIFTRQLAKKREYKLNEKQLIDRNGKLVVLGESEEQILNALALPFVPPELREEWALDYFKAASGSK